MPSSMGRAMSNMGYSYGGIMSLTTRAMALHQCKRNAAKWVLAVRYLRKRNLWVLESGAAKWRCKV